LFIENTYMFFKEGRPDTVEEDTPAGYARALWVTVTKVKFCLVKISNISFVFSVLLIEKKSEECWRREQTMRSVV
jgi:hypothetical protein